MASNRRKGETYTGHELIKSSRTKLVQEIRGHLIYSHTIPQMAGNFVVLTPSPAATDCYDWETFDRFIDAKRSVILPINFECAPGTHTLIQGNHCGACGLAYGDVQSDGTVLQ